jgi:hypothetical protein
LSIAPGAKRKANYQVSKEQLTGHGPYTLNVKIRAAMVPVNLIDAIKDVGFDYGLSPREVAKRVVAGHSTLAERSVVVDVK